jgi:hypothetical protein
MPILYQKSYFKVADGGDAGNMAPVQIDAIASVDVPNG